MLNVKRLGCTLSAAAVCLFAGMTDAKAQNGNPHTLTGDVTFSDVSLNWQAPASDIKIHADHILRTRERLNTILAQNTGKSLKTIEKDVERDHFLTAEQALENVKYTTADYEKIIVVLMHDFSAASLEALPDIIEWLRGEGFILLPPYYDSVMINKG